MAWQISVSTIEAVRQRGRAAVLTRLALLLWLFATPALAAPPADPGAHDAPAVAPITAPPQSAPSTSVLNAQDVKTFFDGLVPYAIQRADIAGAVISVVKDGQILFAQGYGYSDVATRKPVIADQTLFRSGSVGKLFTWTAVMQQVGAGKLDLDRDVNDYLDFKIPPAFGKPITLRNIMTHTPGFEDGISGMFVKEPDQLFPLGDYLKMHIPERIFPAGQVAAYSNYGATLAGYIVERVSGEAYNQYIANHILKPLDMQHSTFVQPLPPALQANMATGYGAASDKKPVPFELIEIAPAGGMSGTATDMAHFMIAHLENGRYGNASMLSPEMTALMHSPQSRMAPGMHAFDLGFYEEDRNGVHIIGHAGDTQSFHSDLHLLPDQHIGIFMSFNSTGKEGEAGKVRTALFRAFLDRYFPYTPPEEKTVADPQPDAVRVAGSYQFSRRIDSGLRLLSRAGQFSVTANPDGTIAAALKDLGGTLKQWREVGPLTYREINGQAHLKFVADNDGRILYWMTDDFVPVLVFQRVTGFQRMGIQKIVFPLFLTTLFLTIAVWFGGWIARKRFGTALVLTPGQARLRLASRIGVLLLLALLGGWAGLVVLLSSSLANGLDGWLMALYSLGLLAALGAIAMLVEAVLRVRRGPGGWLVRTGETLLGLCALYGLWAIYTYGLANFSLNY